MGQIVLGTGNIERSSCALRAAANSRHRDGGFNSDAPLCRGSRQTGQVVWYGHEASYTEEVMCGLGFAGF